MKRFKNRTGGKSAMPSETGVGTTAFNEIIADPVGTLMEDTKHLDDSRIDDKAFSRNWILREFEAELHRYSIEAKFIDTSSRVYRSSVTALANLRVSRDWLHPKLINVLRAFRRTVSLDELEWETVDRVVEGKDHPFTVRGCVPTSDKLFQISNVKARYVPILEQNIGQVELCQGIVSAYSDVISSFKERLGVTHLCFIEKAIGPIGAIGMMSSLVHRTNLPACIYRETHWSRKSDLAAIKPDAGAKVAIVYDLIVSGAGICNAADIVRERVNADVVAAVVLCGFGRKRNTLTTNRGQNLELKSLTWWDEVVPSTIEEPVEIADQHVTLEVEHPRTDARSSPSLLPSMVGGEAAPEKGAIVAEVEQSFVGRPTSLMEKIDLASFDRRVKDSLSSVKNISAVRERRQRSYEAAWSNYKRSVED